MGMNELMDMQKELMEKVPHDLKPEVVPKMWVGVKIIDTLMRYLGSTGHKPWRPNPLPGENQVKILRELWKWMHVLDNLHEYETSAEAEALVREFNHNLGESTPEFRQRQLISALGAIEESVEYLNTLPNKDYSPDDVLEELVDVLFFYMEQVLMSGYSWDQIEEEYHRKWNVNMERYRRAQNGDYGWDKRSEGKL
jgi:phosphoribosyl-ATP pyrophosphohydrolase